jgi:hypothetical protein
VSWQQVVLLIVGFIVICIGVSAAVFRSKRMCRIYGLIMMVYAFVIGLTSLLTGLDTIVLSSAIEKVPAAGFIFHFFFLFLWIVKFIIVW